MRIMPSAVILALVLAACSPPPEKADVTTPASTSVDEPQVATAPTNQIAQGPDLPVTAQPTELGFINAKIRNPQGDRPTAGYLTIENNGSTGEDLVSATSADFGRVEIHTHEKGPDGMMKMTKLDKLAIAAKSQAVFEPGGLHLMLFEPKRTFTAGDNVMVMLNFSNSGVVETKFTILNEIPHKSEGAHSAH